MRKGKLTKENVCVFIEDEQQLEQAISILNKYNERHSRYHDSMLMYLNGKKYNFLRLLSKYWFIDKEQCGLTKITLTELEQILKDEQAKESGNLH